MRPAGWCAWALPALLLLWAAGTEALQTHRTLLRRAPRPAPLAMAASRSRVLLPREQPGSGAEIPIGAADRNLEKRLSRREARPKETRRKRDGDRGQLAAARAAAQAANPQQAVALAKGALSLWSAAAANSTAGSGAAAARGGAATHRMFSLVREVNQLLRILGDRGDLAAAQEVFSEMIECGLTPTQVTYGTLIARAGTWNQPELATAYYRDMQRRGIEPDTLTHNSLINAFAKARDLTKALAVAAAMRRRGLTPTIVTYNTLLDGCARAGNLTLARATLAELRKVGLHPSDRTYSILVHLYARMGHLDEAFGWVEQMRKGGLTPNAVTFSALIHGCGRAGQLSRAFALLSEMEGLGLAPNVVTYTTLVDALCRDGQISHAVAVFRTMVERRIAPNAITCHALFNGCLRQGDVLLAREVLAYMTSAKLRPSAHSFTTLLNAASAAPHLRRPVDGTVNTNGNADKRNAKDAAAFALLLRQLAVATQQTPFAPASPSWQGTGDRIVDNGLSRAALMVDSGMAGEDVSTASAAESLVETEALPVAVRRVWSGLVNSGTAAAVLGSITERDRTSGLPLADRLAEAVTEGESTHDGFLFSSGRDNPSRSARHAPSSHSCEGDPVSTPGSSDAAVASDIDSFLDGSVPPVALVGDVSDPPSAELQRVFAIFDQMSKSGVAPDRAAYNALIHACARAGDVRRAEGAFGEMLSIGIPADAISYTCLLKACAVAGDATRAEMIFVEMQQRTNHFSTFTPPTPHAYAHLMAVQRRAGNAKRVLELFDELRERKLQPAIVHYSLALRACAQLPEAPEQLDRAMSFYEAMRADGFRLDSRGLLAMTKICQAHGRPDVAAQLRRERTMA